MRGYSPLPAIIGHHIYRFAVEFAQSSYLIPALPSIETNLVSQVVRHHALMCSHVVHQLQAFMDTLLQHFKFSHAQTIKINHLYAPRLILTAHLQSVLSRVVVSVLVLFLPGVR